MLTSVNLHGPIGEGFRPEYRLEIGFPGEAFQALCAMVPGFRQALNNHSEYCIVVDGQALPEHLLTLRRPMKRMDIVPQVNGSFFIAPALVALGTSLATATAVATTLSVISALVTIGLGIYSMTTNTPEPDKKGNLDNETYGFNGPLNTTTQGLPVPLLYGELIVGGHLVGTSIKTRYGSRSN